MAKKKKHSITIHHTHLQEIRKRHIILNGTCDCEQLTLSPHIQLNSRDHQDEKNNQVSYRSRTHCKSLHVLRSYSHSMFQKLYINRMINTKAWTRYIKRIRTMSSLIIPPHVLFPTIQSLSQITHTETLPLFRICTAETITKQKKSAYDVSFTWTIWLLQSLIRLAPYNCSRLNMASRFLHVSWIFVQKWQQPLQLLEMEIASSFCFSLF